MNKMRKKLFLFNDVRLKVATSSSTMNDASIKIDKNQKLHNSSAGKRGNHCIVFLYIAL